MELITKGIPYLFFSLCIVALNGAAFASTPKHSYKDYKDMPLRSSNHFEVIGAGGLAKLRAGNSTYAVTGDETDTLVQTNENQWSTLAGQLGGGYVYYFYSNRRHTNHLRWFPSIEPQLNLYQLSSDSIEGNVLRFGSYNQGTFDIPVRSTRLMLDAALTIAAWKQYSVYVKGGIGHAWTRLSYNDSINTEPGCDMDLTLSSHTNSNFVWEAGAGVLYDINNRFGVSLEYLYANLGTVKTSVHGSVGTFTLPLVNAPSFHLRAQTVLLGLHIAV
jgi:opacity protein-like surface antigen